MSKENQILTEKPPWDPNDKERSLEEYGAWLNGIAREAFHEAGGHAEMFFFVTETGGILGCQIPGGLLKEARDAVIQGKASEINPFGTIHIIITKIYHPKLTSHPEGQKLRFAGADSPDSEELVRDCLIVRMLSRTGKDKSWANPIFESEGKKPVLGDTFETYPVDEPTDTEDDYQEDEIESIKCPFCGKRDEGGVVDCPHFICYAQDAMEFYWTDDFKIMDGIIGTINELYSGMVDWDINWEGVFEGIPYWEELSDVEMEYPFDILDKHPFLDRTWRETDATMMATVHNWIFIDNNKKQEFQNILAEVNKRLNKLLRDEERKMEAKNKQMELVFVKGGFFQMGDTFGGGEDAAKPVHEVYVDDFCMGKYEVTQAQWKKVMGSNPARLEKGSNLPAIRVSWNDVQEFIRKLNQQTGNKYRLPTEAEWEYAARSGGMREKWAGTSNEHELEQYAWYSKNAFYDPHSVGEKKPNGLGLHDMSGNVREWCQDWYDPDYYVRSPKDNPKGPESGKLKVLRGGSYADDSQFMRCSNRFGVEPTFKDTIIGFRLVLPPG